jgi:transketolase
MKEKDQLQSKYYGLSSREAFGKVVLELGKENENIVALSADLADSVKLNDFIKEFPNRFINFGVAEQNMMGAAAGLTLAGKIPFACTYAVFSSMRACEQVRTDIAYNELPVKIVSTHSGITFGVAGATHQAIEDIGIYRSMAGMTIISPADGVETAAAIRAAANLDTPVYVRLSRVKEKPVYTTDFDYRIGKPDLVIKGEGLLLIATGPQVGEAIDATKVLQDQGINAGVLNISTIKPINDVAIIDILGNYKAAITIEQHNVINGLGSAVSEVIAENNLNIRFLRHGLYDTFTTSGPYRELLAYYQLDPQGISDTVLRFLVSV